MLWRVDAEIGSCSDIRESIDLTKLLELSPGTATPGDIRWNGGSVVMVTAGAPPLPE